MKANIFIWSTRAGWVENYIHRSEYNDPKMEALFKKPSEAHFGNTIYL